MENNKDTNENKTNNVEFRKIILRNMMLLTEKEKEFVKTISEDDKIEMIIEYDKILGILVKIINDE
jgi:hypothetical protein